MKFPCLIPLIPLAWSLSVLFAGAGAADEEVVLDDHQVIVQVRGVVCSFCAHGTEKNLAELSFLDPAHFGGDGVLMDIHTQRITLALDPDTPVDYGAIHQAITDGGYDAERAYVRVRGVVEQGDGRVLLTSASNGQAYRLDGVETGLPAPAGPVTVEGEVSANDMARLADGEPVPLRVTAIEGAQ